MKKILLLISYNSISVFFLIKLFFYLAFGIDIGVFYSYLMILIGVSVYLIFLFNLLSKKKIKVSFLILIFLMLLVMLFALNNLSDSYVKSSFFYFFVWAVPAALGGILLSNYNKNLVTNFFKCYFWISSLIFIMLGLNYGYSFNNASLTSLTNYQQLSYLSAFSFGLGLYYMNINKIFLVRIIEIFFLLNNLIVCLASGGRGGVILLIMYLLVYIISNIKKLKLINVILLLSILITTVTINFNTLVNERSFSYLNNGRVDLSDASGRDKIYSKAMYYIQDQPLQGYGLFEYYKFFNGVPHNIFLEIMLIGGIIGLLISLVLIIKFVYIFSRKIKFQIVDQLFIYLLLYPSIMLLFSGNFLNVSELWFVVFYILSVNWRKKDEKIH